MSYSYDFQMAEIHALIAWATLLLFVLRGLAVLVHGIDWAMDARLRVLVFGMRGHAYWSGDAGAHWQRSAIATEASLTAGTLLRDGALLLSDETGRLYRSADGGRSFQPIPAEHRAPVTGVLQSAGGGIFLSGMRGVTRLALQ